MPQREDTGHQFDQPAARTQIAEVALGRRHRQRLGTMAEDLVDCPGFLGITHSGTQAMGMDVSDPVGRPAAAEQDHLEDVFHSLIAAGQEFWAHHAAGSSLEHFGMDRRTPGLGR